MQIVNEPRNRNEMTVFGQRFASWINPPWWYAFVTLPWLIGVALLGVQARRDSVRASREQTTAGVITAHDPGNHNSYQYAYSVGGRAFRAWEVAPAVDWSIGEQVVVYYDPRDPGESSLVDFDERSWADAGPIPFLLVGIGGVLAYIGWQRHHNAPSRST